MGYVLFAIESCSTKAILNKAKFWAGKFFVNLISFIPFKLSWQFAFSNNTEVAYMDKIFYQKV